MFVLGHLGIGSKLASPWLRTSNRQDGLPFLPVLLGTLLPDIIDKPIYYLAVWITGRHGAAIGLISSSRAFGHTALLLLAILGVGVVRKSRPLAAVALGMATHLLLDNVSDHFLGAPNGFMPRTTLATVLWPLIGFDFPAFPFTNARDHLAVITLPFVFWCEVAGGLILGLEIWKLRHAPEILEAIRARRIQRRLWRRKPRDQDRGR